MASRRAGRPVAWVAGLSSFLALVVGVTLWLTLRDRTYHAPLTGPGPSHVSPARATALLHALEGAVRRHDASAASRLGATAAARRELAGVARNGRALDVRGLALRYVDQTGGVSASGSWTADVHADWRFAGFDRRPESLEVAVRFGVTDGRLGISRIGGGEHRTPLWLTGPVQVRRTSSSLVLVDGSAPEADRVARLARTAVPQVREVLPAWRGGLVLEVPATQRGLDRSLHAPSGRYGEIAAVTTTVNGSTSRRAPVHVFVNPDVLLPLKPRGAQVVITHEATHVAAGAATSGALIWLVEGFADYVALRAQRIPLATTAARISALVRRSGPPAHLPGSREFATGARHLEAQYEGAWLACRLLARDGGERALVAFYRAVDDGGAVDRELVTHFGFGLRHLTRSWRSLLTHLLA